MNAPADLDSRGRPIPMPMSRWAKIGLGGLLVASGAAVSTAFLPIGESAREIIFGVARFVNATVLVAWVIRWTVQWCRTQYDAISATALGNGMQWLTRVLIGACFIIVVTFSLVGPSVLEWTVALRLMFLVAFVAASTGLMVLILVEMALDRRQARIDDERIARLMADLPAGNGEVARN